LDQSPAPGDPDPALRSRADPAVRRESIDDPGGVERLDAIGLAPDEDEVSRPRAHRQARLDRVPAVVLLDQIVDRVEAPARGDSAPAAVALVGIVLLAPEAPQRLTEPLLVLCDLVLDLPEPLG
jgi:hypothetical protein